MTIMSLQKQEKVKKQKFCNISVLYTGKHETQIRKVNKENPKEAPVYLLQWCKVQS
jgi:hypothetical protein